MVDPSTSDVMTVCHELSPRKNLADIPDPPVTRPASVPDVEKVGKVNPVPDEMATARVDAV